MLLILLANQILLLVFASVTIGLVNRHEDAFTAEYQGESLSQEADNSSLSTTGLKVLNGTAIVSSIVLILGDVYLIQYHAMLIRANTTTYLHIRAKKVGVNIQSRVMTKIDQKLSS